MTIIRSDNDTVFFFAFVVLVVHLDVKMVCLIFRFLICAPAEVWTQHAQRDGRGGGRMG
jgi:hypothetical protein